MFLKFEDQSEIHRTHFSNYAMPTGMENLIYQNWHRP